MRDAYGGGECVGDVCLYFFIKFLPFLPVVG